MRANVLTNFGHEPRSMRKQRQHSAELPLQGRLTGPGTGDVPHRLAGPGLQGRVTAPGTGDVPHRLAGPGLHVEDPGGQAARQQREVSPDGSRHKAFG